MFYKISTTLERFVKILESLSMLNGTRLMLSYDVDQDEHGKVTQTQHTACLKFAAKYAHKIGRIGAKCQLLG